jgi:hypothetical protein
MLLVIEIMEPILEAFGNFVVGPFKVDPAVELVMIMIVFPLVLNAAQFWIVDNILKLPDQKTKEIIELPEDLDKPEMDRLSNHFGDKENGDIEITSEGVNECDDKKEVEEKL